MGRATLVVALVIAATSAAGSRSAVTPRWPSIEALHAQFGFPNAQEAKLKKTIHGKDGAPLYVLECYAFPVAPGAEVFNYSGDFECVLHLYGRGHGYSTLLTELPHADADWESRGRFLAGQLVEPCGKYHNLGRQRTFRLRGLELTLTLTHVVFDPQKKSLWGNAPALKSFDVEVDIVPDPTAMSDIAAEPRLPSLENIPSSCRQAFSSLYLYQFRRPKPAY